MKKFIELLKELKQECEKQIDKHSELNDGKYHSICEGCRLAKQCDLAYSFSEKLFSNGVSGLDIKAIKNITKELGVYEDNN